MTEENVTNTTQTDLNVESTDTGTPTTHIPSVITISGTINDSENKFWNRTNIFFGLAICICGFLVYLMTQLNLLGTKQDGTTRALDKNETKLELISNDIKEIKFHEISIDEDIADIKKILQQKK